MIEIEIGDVRWYGVSRIFPTPEEAKAAFDLVHDTGGDGYRQIGIYRHQRIGLDSGPVLVSAVGHKREGVEEAEALLGGEEVELHPSTWLEMIDRRAKMVNELLAAGESKGVFRIPHSPEGDRI